nr:MAG TPA: hypothetical protein [Caudoviricetes sp.]
MRSPTFILSPPIIIIYCRLHNCNKNNCINATFLLTDDIQGGILQISSRINAILERGVIND